MKKWGFEIGDVVLSTGNPNPDYAWVVMGWDPDDRGMRVGAARRDHRPGDPLVEVADTYTENRARSLFYHAPAHYWARVYSGPALLGAIESGKVAGLGCEALA